MGKNETEITKERNITVKLSDTDCKALVEKCGQYGLTVGELLENFIGDLVGSSHSYGSNERMYASQWFAQSSFGMFPEPTLLNHLLSWGHDPEDYLDAMDGLKEAEKEKEYAIVHPEEYDAGAIEFIDDSIADYRDSLENMRNGWEPHGEPDMEQEIATIREWVTEKEDFMNQTNESIQQAKSESAQLFEDLRHDMLYDEHLTGEEVVKKLAVHNVLDPGAQNEPVSQNLIFRLEREGYIEYTGADQYKWGFVAKDLFTNDYTKAVSSEIASVYQKYELEGVGKNFQDEVQQMLNRGRYGFLENDMQTVINTARNAGNMEMLHDFTEAAGNLADYQKNIKERIQQETAEDKAILEELRHDMWYDGSLTGEEVVKKIVLHDEFDQSMLHEPVSSKLMQTLEKDGYIQTVGANQYQWTDKSKVWFSMDYSSSVASRIANVYEKYEIEGAGKHLHQDVRQILRKENDLQNDIQSKIVEAQRAGNTHMLHDFTQAAEILSDYQQNFKQWTEALSRQTSLEADSARLFLDLDGTAAEFKQVDTLETLYEKGYFLNLKPNQGVLDAIHNIMASRPDIQVYVLSSVLSDSKYALEEKNAWIDRYLPEIDAEHRIFPPCGEDKKEFIPQGIRSTDFLLDDYTHNLTLWEPPARGIKLLNGINHTNGTWKSDALRFDKSPDQLAKDILQIMDGGEHIIDERPAKAADIVRTEDYQKFLHTEEITNESDMYRLLHNNGYSKLAYPAATPEGGVFQRASGATDQQVMEAYGKIKSETASMVRQSGFKPSNHMVKNVMKINMIAGKNYTMQSLAQLYRESRSMELDNAMKNIADEVGKEFAGQELAQKTVAAIPEAVV
ncbi:MAG: hypothetical protein MSA09_06050 [Lachnospiraceae bacterium]|nr:hypothetical protein [Lachnospiraceae bacterium]